MCLLVMLLLIFQIFKYILDKSTLGVEWGFIVFFVFFFNGVQIVIFNY